MERYTYTTNLNYFDIFFCISYIWVSPPTPNSIPNILHNNITFLEVTELKFYLYISVRIKNS